MENKSVSRGGRQVRTRVVYEGRVQGVGFRWSTLHIARSFRTAGFVRNLPDGRVEVVAEGGADEVRRFLDEVALRLERFIQVARATDEPPTGEFSSFDIAY